MSSSSELEDTSEAGSSMLTRHCTLHAKLEGMRGGMKMCGGWLVVSLRVAPSLCSSSTTLNHRSLTLSPIRALVKNKARDCNVVTWCLPVRVLRRCYEPSGPAKPVPVQCRCCLDVHSRAEGNRGQNGRTIVTCAVSTVSPAPAPHPPGPTTVERSGAGVA